MNTVDKFPVHQVAMPLVRLMRDGNLSWADKVEIAGVIRDVLKTKKAMEEESAHLRGTIMGQAAASQTRAAAAIGQSKERAT